MTGYRGLDTEEGWQQRRFADLQRQMDEQSAARRLVVASDFISVDTTSIPNFTLPGSYLAIVSRAVTVPPGYAFALIQASSVASVSVTGSSSDTSVSAAVGVQTYGYADGAYFEMPGVTNGRNGGGNLSATAPGVLKVACQSTLTIGVTAAKNSVTGTTAGYDFASLSALVLFSRT